MQCDIIDLRTLVEGFCRRDFAESIGILQIRRDFAETNLQHPTVLPPECTIGQHPSKKVPVSQLLGVFIAQNHNFLQACAFEFKT